MKLSNIKLLIHFLFGCHWHITMIAAFHFNPTIWSCFSMAVICSRFSANPQLLNVTPAKASLGISNSWWRVCAYSLAELPTIAIVDQSSSIISTSLQSWGFSYLSQVSWNAGFLKIFQVHASVDLKLGSAFVHGILHRAHSLVFGIRSTLRSPSLILDEHALFWPLFNLFRYVSWCTFFLGQQKNFWFWCYQFPALLIKIFDLIFSFLCSFFS